MRIRFAEDMSTRTMPSTSQLLTPIAAGAAVLLAAASLTGCSQLLDSLHKVHQESYTSYAEAAEGWVGVDIPSWIPEDATELRLHRPRVVRARDLHRDRVPFFAELGHDRRERAIEPEREDEIALRRLRRHSASWREGRVEVARGGETEARGLGDGERGRRMDRRELGHAENAKARR